MQCYLCKTRTRVIRRTIRGGIKRNVLQCAKCGLVALAPSKKLDAAFYQKKYRKNYGPRYGHGVSPAEAFKTYLPIHKERVADLRGMLSKKMRLLDVGCSSGAFLSAVRPYVGEAAGNEPNLADAAFVRKKLGIQVETAPLLSAPFAPHSFDIVTLWQTLEHIEDPSPFLRAIRRVLKRRGTLVVEVPNLNDWLLTCFDLPGHQQFYFREAHAFYYTPETLRRMLRLAGFKGKISGATYIPNVLNQFHWIFRDSPQADAAEVYAPLRVPVLRDIDEAYRKSVRRRLLSESILFIGKQK